MNTFIINIDPEIMSGAPVFRGTRVTIQTLFDHLENGKTLDDFLEGFPSVTKENALAVLELAKFIIGKGSTTVLPFVKWSKLESCM